MAALRNYSALLLVITCCQFYLAWSEICDRPICEYEFTVKKTRTMSYRAKTGTYNVHLKDNRLIATGNSYHKRGPDDNVIDTLLNPNDVITGDGLTRNMFVINDMFPGPKIEVMAGSEVRVRVLNMLNTEGISIHWHGVEMYGSPYSDGTVYITQCPIMPYQKFTYKFTAITIGTHWYHAHFATMRLDSFLGFIIIHERPPTIPYFTMSVMEWLHVDYDTMILMNPHLGGTGEIYLTKDNTDFVHDGNEVNQFVFFSALINGRGRWDQIPIPLHHFMVRRGRKYRFRTAHTGADAPFIISIDRHLLDIVATGGQEIEPIRVDYAIIFPGETMDFEITATQSQSSYWVRANMLRSGSGPSVKPDNIVKGTLAILKYENSGIPANTDPTSNPRECTSAARCKVFNCPFKGYPRASHKVCININEAKSRTHIYDNRHKYGLDERNEDIVEMFLNVGLQLDGSINGRKFAQPRRPLLFENYENYITPCNNTQCDTVGCQCTHIVELPYGKTIQLVMSNYQPGAEVMVSHPMHTHGHRFAVLHVGYPDYNEETGRWERPNDDITCDSNLCAKPRWTRRRPEHNFNLINPPTMDTLAIPARGYAVVRFKADMPGYWFLHCHQDDHFLAGIIVVFKEGTEHVVHPPNFPTCGDWEP